MQLANSDSHCENKASRNSKAADPLDRYRPSGDEPFMNERQREYFRAKLLEWREDILQEARETIQHLQDDSQSHADPLTALLLRPTERLSYAPATDSVS